MGLQGSLVLILIIFVTFLRVQQDVIVANNLVSSSAISLLYPFTSLVVAPHGETHVKNSLGQPSFPFFLCTVGRFTCFSFFTLPPAMWLTCSYLSDTYWYLA